MLPAVLVLALACILVFSFWDLPAFRGLVRMELHSDSLWRALKRRSLWKIGRAGLPLGITSALLVLATNAPRYFLERSWGERDLGHFAALAYPVVGFSMVVAAFCQAATPRLAEAFAHEPGRFWQLIGRLVTVPIIGGLAAFVVLAPFGRQFLTTIYTEEYASHCETLLILIGAGAVWGVAAVLGFGTTAAGVRDGQVWVSILVCTVALATSAMLVPRWGLDGAAASFCITGALSLALYGLLLKSASSGRERRPPEA